METKLPNGPNLLSPVFLSLPPRGNGWMIVDVILESADVRVDHAFSNLIQFKARLITI
jgi:hypothetical protein